MRRVALVMLMVLGLVPALCAPAAAGATPDGVVKRFYGAWMAVVGADPYVKGSEERCLQAQRACFEPSFYAVFMKAWNLNTGTAPIEGFDFDPFLNAQTGFTALRVGRPVGAGSAMKVPVYARESRGGRPVGPEGLRATAVVTRHDGAWVISDVLSPQPSTKESPSSLRALSAQLVADHARRNQKRKP